MLSNNKTLFIELENTLVVSMEDKKIKMNKKLLDKINEMQSKEYHVVLVSKLDTPKVEAFLEFIKGLGIAITDCVDIVDFKSDDDYLIHSKAYNSKIFGETFVSYEIPEDLIEEMLENENEMLKNENEMLRKNIEELEEELMNCKDKTSNSIKSLRTISRLRGR